MIDWDKALLDFKNMMSQQDSMKIVRMIEAGYKGKLMIVQILLSNNGKLFAGELAQRLGVSTARVAVAIKSLEQKGYVNRCQSETDARKVEISITELGVEVLNNYVKKADDFLKEKLQKFNEEELITFTKLSKKFFS